MGYPKKKKKRAKRAKRDWTNNPVVLKSWLIPRLRSISRYWPEANEALKLSRKLPGRHECASCKGLFKQCDVQRDHILPMIQVTGFTNWHDVITRLFCSRLGFQILCKTCHSHKTDVENEERKAAVPSP